MLSRYKEIFVNAQWQGGGDLVTYDGAKGIIELYMDGEVQTEYHPGMKNSCLFKLLLPDAIGMILSERNKILQKRREKSDGENVRYQ